MFWSSKTAIGESTKLNFDDFGCCMIEGDGVSGSTSLCDLYFFSGVLWFVSIFKVCTFNMTSHFMFRHFPIVK